MPDFLTSKKMMLIFVGVAVIVVAVAVYFVLTSLAPTGQTSYVTFMPEVPDPPENVLEPERPPGRWDDAFLEENVFVPPNSRLTGLPVTEEAVNRRPLAVVINNIHRALPQSGISSADIIYEVLSEGDVTRLVAIFQSYVPEKIGPVRSARDYFVDFAFNHDAVFIHHGASPSGYGRIRGQRICVIDGMTWEGRVFWRDRTYPYWHHNSGTRPLEHSSFTGEYRLTPHLYAQQIRDYMAESQNYGFIFADNAPVQSGGQAHTVSIPFSPNYTRTFIFDEELNIYHVENRDGAHQDAINQEQVTVSNILVQLTAKSLVPGDADGRRNVQTIGQGR